jgi:hypothetical protein
MRRFDLNLALVHRPCRLKYTACRGLPRTSQRSSPSRSVVLRTIGDAANYVLALPPERAELCNRWRWAAELIPEQADVAAVSRQLHLALFYDAQLDIGAMPG